MSSQTNIHLVKNSLWLALPVVVVVVVVASTPRFLITKMKEIENEIHSVTQVAQKSEYDYCHSD